MRLIQVAAAVLNQTPLAWESNMANMRQALRAAREQEVSIVCLPELCITGYGCEDAFQATHVQRTALEVLHEMLPDTRGMIVSFGLPLQYRGGLFNTACLAADGRILGFVAKQNLAGEGMHYEPRWFKPWPGGSQAHVEISGRAHPLGDLIFDCGGVRLGFEICEDAWVASRPGAQLALAGVDVILNPSASHFAFGKHEVRKRFVLEGSRAFSVSYIYANLLGNEAGRAIYDGDAMVASAGTMLASGPRFSFRDAHLTSATIDVDATRMIRARQGSFRPQIAGGRDRCVTVDFSFPAASPRPTRLQPAAWETGQRIKEEEFARALALALFDYLRKSRSRGFVISLSGGADSSAVAILSAWSLQWAWQELDSHGIARKLDYLPPVESAEQLVRQLLTCVYQSTRNSSQVTRDAARDVAQAVGAEFLEFPVDPIVASYEKIVAQAIGRELTWESDDLARQNIQARARSPGVWLLANLRGALLLATSNRSEAAVGYATMDGDTSGGLSPIAGIDKAFLRNWLRWLETEGPAGVGPLAAVQAVNSQQPTAELRPPQAGQTDELDLMPYDVLDAIERAAIRDKLSPLESWQVVIPLFPHHDRAALAAWVTRFFRLWCRNQWKRERYAPSFHLDDENLDPKTWCRFPILSGGYERELAGLEAAAAS
jgi:NAD+ synthase (glutamine-hydrolysing)